jgi:hypothetical protein
VRGTAGALNKAEALGGAGALGRTGAPSAREAQPGRARSLARYPVAAGGRAA